MIPLRILSVVVTMTMCLCITMQACIDVPSAAVAEVILTPANFTPIRDLQPWCFTWATTRTASSLDPFDVDRSRNISDWMSFLGASVRVEDVDDFLYSLSPERVIPCTSVASFVTMLSANSMIRELNRRNDTLTLSYLLLSKRLEHLDLHSAWIYNRERYFESVRQELLRGITSSTSSWLRRRYIYQYLRTAQPGPDVVRLVESEYVSERPTSLIHQWTLLRYAESLLRIGRQADANRALAYVFDACPTKRPRALQLFTSDGNAYSDAYQQGTRQGGCPKSS